MEKKINGGLIKNTHLEKGEPRLKSSKSQILCAFSIILISNWGKNLNFHGKGRQSIKELLDPSFKWSDFSLPLQFLMYWCYFLYLSVIFASSFSYKV